MSSHYEKILIFSILILLSINFTSSEDILEIEEEEEIDIALRERAGQGYYFPTGGLKIGIDGKTHWMVVDQRGELSILYRKGYRQSKLQGVNEEPKDATGLMLDGNSIFISGVEDIYKFNLEDGELEKNINIPDDTRISGGITKTDSNQWYAIGSKVYRFDENWNKKEEVEISNKIPKKFDTVYNKFKGITNVNNSLWVTTSTNYLENETYIHIFDQDWNLISTKTKKLTLVGSLYSNDKQIYLFEQNPGKINIYNYNISLETSSIKNKKGETSKNNKNEENGDGNAKERTIQTENQSNNASNSEDRNLPELNKSKDSKGKSQNSPRELRDSSETSPNASSTEDMTENTNKENNKTQKIRESVRDSMEFNPNKKSSPIDKIANKLKNVISSLF